MPPEYPCFDDLVGLSIVIPALNEQRGIGDTLRQVLQLRERLTGVGIALRQLIVVNDGSTDKTADIAASHEGTLVITHVRTLGYGAALKSGFRAASGDLIGFLDADGTYPADQFPFLCRMLLEQDADIVVGSRRSGRSSRMPVVRRAGNLVWAILVSWFGNHRIEDPASGMRVLKRSVLEKLEPLPDGLNFTPIMTTRAVQEGLKLVEMPIPYESRVGDSKLSVVRDGTRFLGTILWTLMQYNPARIFGTTGGLLVLVSLLIGAALVSMRLSGITSLGPLGTFSAYAALVSGVLGVSTGMLALVVDQLFGIFRQKHRSKQEDSGLRTANLLGRNSGWVGLLAVLAGSGVGGVAVALGIQGWPIERLWLWLVGSALFVLAGTHLLIFGLLLAILQALPKPDSPTGTGPDGSGPADDQDKMAESLPLPTREDRQ